MLYNGVGVKEGLHRGPAAAHLALMGPVVVVLIHPLIQVSLQLLEAGVYPLSEGHVIELVQDGLVEAPEAMRPGLVTVREAGHRLGALQNTWS